MTVRHRFRRSTRPAIRVSRVIVTDRGQCSLTPRCAATGCVFILNARSRWLSSSRRDHLLPRPRGREVCCTFARDTSSGPVHQRLSPRRTMPADPRPATDPDPSRISVAPVSASVSQRCARVGIVDHRARRGRAVPRPAAGPGRGGPDTAHDLAAGGLRGDGQRRRTRLLPPARPGDAYRASAR